MTTPCRHDNGAALPRPSDRRAFLRTLARGIVFGGMGALGATLWRRGRLAACAPGAACATCAAAGDCAVVRPRRSLAMVWQLDPTACVQCGRCATACVLTPSAVTCMHDYAVCGYCKLCFGYFDPRARDLNANAENQRCPTGALVRTFIEDPYYEYRVDERRCIGCGACVRGCTDFGNGSLFLQVNHVRCVGCNDCAIARVCPADAFRRVPAETPYILKRGGAPRHAPGSCRVERLRSGALA